MTETSFLHRIDTVQSCSFFIGRQPGLRRQAGTPAQVGLRRVTGRFAQPGRHQSTDRQSRFMQTDLCRHSDSFAHKNRPGLRRQAGIFSQLVNTVCEETPPGLRKQVLWYVQTGSQACANRLPGMNKKRNKAWVDV